MWWVTTHVSALKSNTVFVTYLKKELETRGLAPYLFSILVVLLETARTFIRFQINSGQS